MSIPKHSRQRQFTERLIEHDTGKVLAEETFSMLPMEIRQERVIDGVRYRVTGSYFTSQKVLETRLRRIEDGNTHEHPGAPQGPGSH